jgi:hypothetical protein
VHKSRHVFAVFWILYGILLTLNTRLESQSLFQHYHTREVGRHNPGWLQFPIQGLCAVSGLKNRSIQNTFEFSCTDL